MSTLYLYRETKISPEKKFVFDDLLDYLSTTECYASHITIYDFQYLKIQLVMPIKVDMNQSLLIPSEINDFDYMRVSQAGHDYYFFINNKKWKSKETVELDCSLDSLNTFHWNVDYIVSPKTLVKREHKNMYRKMYIQQNGYTGYVYLPLIHLFSEGINPPLYKSEEVVVQDKGLPSWNLIYKNRNEISPSDYNQVNPVDCYLATSSPVEVRSDTPVYGATYLSFSYSYNVLNNVSSIEYDGKTYSANLSTKRFIVSKSGTTISIYICNLDIEYNPQTNVPLYYILGLKTLLFSITGENGFKPNIEDMSVQGANTLPPNTRYRNYKQELYIYGATYDILISYNSTTGQCSMESIDRSDAKMIKIINLPYAPYDFTRNEYDNRIEYNENDWTFDSSTHLFKLGNSELPFRHSMELPINPTTNGSALVMSSVFIGASKKRNLISDTLDGKILHSEYFMWKFVYDSFSYNFPLEQIDREEIYEKCNEDIDFKLHCNFVVSKNIVSKFMFDFYDIPLKYSTQDYDHVLCVARNNEEVLYTSAYINYLRTGYNYDLKSKERNEASGGVSLGLSTIGTIAGLVGGLATQNYALAVGSIVAGGISIANSSISYAKSVAQSEQNIQQKLDEARNQAVSVRNADDIDLLNEYTYGNKAKMVLYQCSPTMRKALLDMFYYSGYSTQEQKVPDTYTRVWFNFVQCDLVIEKTININGAIMDDIKAKFSEGCTFMHKYDGKYDIAQEMQNLQVNEG